MDQGNGEVEYLGVEIRQESPGKSAPPVPGIIDQGVGKVQERDADCSKGTTEVAYEQDSKPRSMWNQGAECFAEVPSWKNNTYGIGPPFKVSQISLANLFQSQIDNSEPKESAKESSMQEPEELTQRDNEEDSPSQGTESNFMHQYSMAELRQHQLEDPSLCPVIGWIESGQSLFDAELLLQSVSTKHYWHCQNQLKIRRSVVLHMGQGNHETGSFSNSTVIEGRYHQNVSWHPQTKTLQNSSRGHTGMSWPGTSLCMSPHAENAAKTNAQPVIQERHFSVSRQGTQEITFIWTCWALSPPANMETSMCWWALINSQDGSKWSYCIFKMPIRLREPFFRTMLCVGGAIFHTHPSTDQGWNFESALFHSFCHLLEAVKSHTIPYRPSANGQIECYNQLVLNFHALFPREASTRLGQVSTSSGHEHPFHGQEEHWFHP